MKTVCALLIQCIAYVWVQKIVTAVCCTLRPPPFISGMPRFWFFTLIFIAFLAALLATKLGEYPNRVWLIPPLICALIAALVVHDSSFMVLEVMLAFGIGSAVVAYKFFDHST